MFDKVLNDFNDLLTKGLWIAGVVCVLMLVILLITKRDALRDYFINSFKWLPYGMGNGIVFGRRFPFRLLCSPTQDEGHVLVIGGTGKGKTTALLVPTLNAWRGTSFSIDISGDIYKSSKVKNKMLIAPILPTVPGAKSVAYNILAPIDAAAAISPAKWYEAIERFCYQIIPETHTTSDAGHFYQIESRKMLTGVLIGLLSVKMDFCEICSYVLASDWRQLLGRIDKLHNTQADMYIASFAGASEQNNAGIKQTLDGYLRLFATNSNVQRIVHRPRKGEITLSPMSIEKYNVFLAIPKDEIEIYAPLMRIVSAQILKYCESRPINKHNILLNIDEFGEIGKVDGIISALAGMRKNRVRVMLLTQALSQIDDIYGENKRITIVENCAYYVIMSARDPSNQLYCARLLGKKALFKLNSGKPEEDWRIRPERFGKLGNTLVVIHPNGYKRVRKNYCWRWWY